MRPTERRKRRDVWISGTVLLFVLAIAVFAPVISPHDPLKVDIGARLRGPFWSAAGHPDHILGTDQLGRDVLSRILYGTRTSLTVGGLSVLLGSLLGTGLGLAAGYWRGIVDGVFGRIADIQQTLPFIVIVLALAAVTPPSTTNVILLLGISSWVVHYRVVRATVYSVKELPYIESARAVGNSSYGIIARHIMPNVWPVVIANIAIFVPQMILFEAALSFLGLGIPPPTPTWGGMIADGRGYVEVAWWLSVFPGLMLGVTVLAIHLLADRLGERLNPVEREH